MAKQTKQTKQAQVPNLKQYAEQFGVLIWGFVESAVLSESRSKEAIRIVATMYDSMDATTYKGAIASLFGNGERGKLNVKGSLMDAFDAKCKAANPPIPAGAIISARTFVSHVRAVALEFGNPNVRAVAEKRGVRAARDIARPKPVSTNASKTPEKPLITLPELIGKMVEELGGAVKVAKMMESAFLAKKDAIHAGICRDFALKLAA